MVIFAWGGLTSGLLVPERSVESHDVVRATRFVVDVGKWADVTVWRQLDSFGRIGQLRCLQFEIYIEVFLEYWGQKRYFFVGICDMYSLRWGCCSPALNNLDRYHTFFWSVSCRVRVALEMLSNNLFRSVLIRLVINWSHCFYIWYKPVMSTLVQVSVCVFVVLVYCICSCVRGLYDNTYQIL